MANKIVQLKDGSDNVYPAQDVHEISITLDTDYITGGTQHIYRQGRTCIASFSFNLKALATANTNYVVATIPAEDAPQYIQFFVLMSINSTKMIFGMIRNNGEIVLTATGAVNSAGWFDGSAAWLRKSD